MYDDKITVANKIITDRDIEEIIDRMNERLVELKKINAQETRENERLEREYQRWTLNSFVGNLECTFNLYDDTEIKVDNYNAIMTFVHNRLHEIKYMWLYFHISYFVKNGIEDNSNLISHTIHLYIYEDKMNIDVKLSSADNKIEDIFRLIKEKIARAPKKYDRVIKNKSFIVTKASLAMGLIPALVVCTLLAFVPEIRDIYAKTYVVFPIASVILAFLIGSIGVGSKLDRLYEPLSPEKKYAGYDANKGKSIYKDDVEKYINTSEIIIGKNIDNIKNRKEIIATEKKYDSILPIGLIGLVVLSLIMILIGMYF